LFRLFRFYTEIKLLLMVHTTLQYHPNKASYTGNKSKQDVLMREAFPEVPNAPRRLELPALNYSLKPIVDGLAGEQ
jgi:hypothetical protein